MTSMKEIVSKKLVDSYCYQGIFCLDFSPEVVSKYGNNDSEKFHKYSLKIQCPFRFILHNNIIVASYDMRIQKDLDDKMNNTKFDKFLKEKVLPMLPTKILDLNINSLGDIHIKFSNDLVFETFIDSRADAEHWRLSDETKDFKEDLIFVKDENEFAEKSNNYLWLESHMLRNLY